MAVNMYTFIRNSRTGKTISGERKMITRVKGGDKFIDKQHKELSGVMERFFI